MLPNVSIKNYSCKKFSFCTVLYCFSQNYNSFSPHTEDSFSHVLLNFQRQIMHVYIQLFLSVVHIVKILIINYTRVYMLQTPGNSNLLSSWNNKNI